MKDRVGPSASRVVVMTGATSGLGVHALQHLAHEPGTRIIVGARGSGRAVPAGVETLPLDLTSLASVRAFAAGLTRQLNGAPIDALVLNAGMQTTNSTQVSADGFELTFAVNHLAHYLLVRLLLPLVADGGRIVITTSETHDPAMSPLAPKTFEPQTWARPRKEGFASGQRAYGASKLGNMLTARSLAAAGEVKGRGITVIAFSPGLTGGTGLGRDAPRAARIILPLVMHTVFRVISIFRPHFAIGTPERAGQVLAQAASGTLTPPPGRIYMNVVRGNVAFPEPSKMALDNEIRDRMWNDSAAMVGLTNQPA
ncbi:SDR family NAD(P)-dependent oxidoreductase [Phytohabitans aurantiacus]|uniref:Dehydrogenase/reductase n=1 Tax=Phytohabitans aurantiacus TaxID=3016789 RepID=A0ABQ5QX21_9ACTN|nr:SDR family NAD(P)-dependent oxidoreductase [Phytohabitans aurantiacus]GLH98840.1 putative dehydrogenase/reductase [Phytohabitans aurantiacus]